jgi:hypothetical protein
VKTQSTISSLIPEQNDSLTNNVVEAMNILFRSVERRMVSERIKRGLALKKMKDAGQRVHSGI